MHFHRKASSHSTFPLALMRSTVTTHLDEPLSGTTPPVPIVDTRTSATTTPPCAMCAIEGCEFGRARLAKHGAQCSACDSVVRSLCSGLCSDCYHTKHVPNWSPGTRVVSDPPLPPKVESPFAQVCSICLLPGCEFVRAQTHRLLACGKCKQQVKTTLDSMCFKCYHKQRNPEWDERRPAGFWGGWICKQ